jgi:hypothetical protein
MDTKSKHHKMNTKKVIAPCKFEEKKLPSMEWFEVVRSECSCCVREDVYHNILCCNTGKQKICIRHLNRWKDQHKIFILQYVCINCNKIYL